MAKKSRERRKREKQRRKPRIVADDVGNGTLSDEQDLDDGPPELTADHGDELPPPFVTEKLMRSMFGGGLLGRRDKRSRAQDLAYRAMETQDPLKSATLCTKALDLDPNCVDAFVHLAQLTFETRAELIEQIRRAVEIGERGLGGAKYFKENRGYFWGLLETRPYMRARAFLTELLVEDGQTTEAIGEYEELLKLNPNDNQGLRYPLLGLYLAAGNLHAVRRLFKEYEDEGSAMFAWGLVLERFLDDDEDGAAAALKEAHGVNKHVEKYLTGKKRLPKRLPKYYGFGDENEAVICVDSLWTAWKRNPKAVKWLKQAG